MPGADLGNDSRGCGKDDGITESAGGSKKGQGFRPCNPAKDANGCKERGGQDASDVACPVNKQAAAEPSQCDPDIKKGKAGGSFQYGKVLHMTIEVHQPGGGADFGRYISEVR